MSGFDLTNANLTNANLNDVKIQGINLTGIDLSGRDLSGFDLTNANLTNANLTGVDLSGRDLSGFDLTNANLTDANLKNANLTNANLTYANLRNAKLRNAHLTDAKIQVDGVNLTGVDLSRRDLSGFDLTNANLTDANLTEANMTNAYLTNANLTNANLTDANLTNANLTNANLTDAKIHHFTPLLTPGQTLILESMLPISSASFRKVGEYRPEHTAEQFDSMVKGLRNVLFLIRESQQNIVFGAYLETSYYDWISELNFLFSLGNENHPPVKLLSNGKKGQEIHISSYGLRFGVSDLIVCNSSYSASSPTVFTVLGAGYEGVSVNDSTLAGTPDGQLDVMEIYVRK